MSETTDNPNVQAVREARRKLAEEAGFSLRKLLADLKSQEQATTLKIDSPRRRQTT